MFVSGERDPQRVDAAVDDADDVRRRPARLVHAVDAARPAVLQRRPLDARPAQLLLRGRPDADRDAPGRRLAAAAQEPHAAGDGPRLDAAGAALQERGPPRDEFRLPAAAAAAAAPRLPLQGQQEQEPTPRDGHVRLKLPLPLREKRKTTAFSAGLVKNVVLIFPNRTIIQKSLFFSIQDSFGRVL